VHTSAPPGATCCGGTTANTCAFAKALLAQQAGCTLAQRGAVGERVLVTCASPVARTNCGLLAALLHERARFALHLAPGGRPLIHAQALRLQCGGVAALAHVLGQGTGDVHALVGLAHERHGSLTDLPWSELVLALMHWQAPRHGRARR
jgi:hypothetical protein